MLSGNNEGLCTITAYTKDDWGNESGQTTKTYNRDTLAPIISEVKAETVSGSTTAVKITVTANDQNDTDADKSSQMKEVEVTLTSKTGEAIKKTITGYTSSTKTQSITIDNLVSGAEYTVKAVAVDKVGNRSGEHR